MAPTLAESTEQQVPRETQELSDANSHLQPGPTLCLGIESKPVPFSEGHLDPFSSIWETLLGTLV